jgi:hypothetical protein
MACCRVNFTFACLQIQIINYLNLNSVLCENRKLLQGGYLKSATIVGLLGVFLSMNWSDSRTSVTQQPLSPSRVNSLTDKQ